MRENIIIALQAIRGWTRPIPRKEQDALCERYIKELGIRPADPERMVKNLLQGETQQKVLLARWLATNPEVYFLTNPLAASTSVRKPRSWKLSSSWPQMAWLSSLSPQLSEVASNRILVPQGPGTTRNH